MEKWGFLGGEIGRLGAWSGVRGGGAWGGVGSGGHTHPRKSFEGKNGGFGEKNPKIFRGEMGVGEAKMEVGAWSGVKGGGACAGVGSGPRPLCYT